MRDETFAVSMRDGAEIHGRDIGDRRAPVLCLVSGLNGEASFWDAVALRLAARFRLVLHDHRGTGRSTRSRITYSIGQMADDLLQVMDARDVSQAVIVGHSTGGAITQVLALAEPQRVPALVLSATWAGPDAYFSTLFELRLQVLRGLGTNVHARLGALVRDDPATFSRHDLATLSDGQAEDGSEILASRIEALLAHDTRQVLPRLSQPAHIVCANDDRVTPPHLSRELERLMSGATLSILDGGGHFAPRTRSEAWLGAVEPFLTRVTS